MLSTNPPTRREVPSSKNSAAPADGCGRFPPPIVHGRPRFHSASLGAICGRFVSRPVVGAGAKKTHGFHSPAPLPLAASDGKPSIPSLSAGREKCEAFSDVLVGRAALAGHPKPQERRAVTNSRRSAKGQSQVARSLTGHIVLRGAAGMARAQVTTTRESPAAVYSPWQVKPWRAL